jgi:prevent-host-death family protein
LFFVSPLRVDSDAPTSNSCFMKVSVAHAKIKLSELLKTVELGQTVTICRRGVPVANIVRAEAPKGRGKPKFGTMRDKIIINDPDWWKPMELVYSHEIATEKRSGS